MKKKLFFITVISLFALGANAKTVHIQLPGPGIHYNYEWVAGDTFIIHKPIGFGSSTWMIENAIVAFEDSLVLIPTTTQQYEITLGWAGNYFGIYLNLYTKIHEKKLDVCANSDPVDLASIMKGIWMGEGIQNNKFYPTIMSPGIYGLFGSRGDTAVAITVTVHSEPPIVFIVPDTKKGKPIKLDDCVAPKGGTFIGDGVVKQTDGWYFHPKLVAKGTYSITYTYTSSAGCCAAQFIYFTNK